MTPSCRLEIKAVPNAQKTEVIGWLEETMKIKVRAPALKGKANEELCSFLAETLDLPKCSVRLLQGDIARKKLVEITGMTRDQAVALLLP